MGTDAYLPIRHVRRPAHNCGRSAFSHMVSSPVGVSPSNSTGRRVVTGGNGGASPWLRERRGSDGCPKGRAPTHDECPEARPIRTPTLCENDLVGWLKRFAVLFTCASGKSLSLTECTGDEGSPTKILRADATDVPRWGPCAAQSMGCMASGVQSVPLGAVALALSLWALGGPAGSPTRCMPDHGVAEEDASATVMTEFFTNGWPPELSPIRSLVPLAIHTLRAQGLREAPDVGLVPRQLLFETVMNDDSFLTMDADVINTLVDKMRDMARAHLDGWSDFRLRRIFAKVDSEVQAPRPRAASWTHSAVVPAGRFNSKARADAAARNLGRLAMSVLDGDNTSPAAPPPLTLQTQTESKMTKLLDSIHVWVCKHAPESPRMAELGSMPTVMELNLQRDMYREGSRSVQVVRNRFRLARNMHADIRSVGWELHEVTPWRIAAWAKGQKSRCKTGAAQAKLAILWLERCLGYDMYSKHTLVTAQMKQTKEGAKEKPASAKAPPLEVALSLEEQIWKAPTPILQAFAGAAAPSTLGSCRWSDANRCRNISLIDDAVLGERLSKTSSEWEPWQAMAMGISGAQWARQWLLVLAEQNLPGADFVLQGCNSRFTQWKPRVAEYNDAERALRVLLMLPPLSYSPDQATEQACDTSFRRAPRS